MRDFAKFAVVTFVVLSACAEKELALEGERLDVRTPVAGAVTSAAQPVQFSSALNLPPPQSIVSWPHRGGSTEHRSLHGSLSTNPAQIWSVSIGSGETRRARITADPVSDGTRIFTIDSAARLSAVTKAGSVAWTRDLTPTGEQAGLASGGALAVVDGKVYAASPYGTLTAFDAGTGAQVWQQKLDAAPSGPPVVRSGVVYLVTRDNRAWALEAASGRIRWQLSGLPTTTAFSGGAGPALNATTAVFPFSSGELIAVLRNGGSRLWSESVSGRRIGRVYGAIGDFAAEPVIDGPTLYAGTQSGRLVAIDLKSGARNWTAQFGALGQILKAGNALWVVSDQGELLRVRPSDGAVVWSRDLPYFTTAKIKKRLGIHAHFGPILASGRLLIASSDGHIRAFDPASGAPMGSVDLPGGAAVAPIIVGNTLYVVTADGNLRAFR